MRKEMLPLAMRVLFIFTTLSIFKPSISLSQVCVDQEPRIAALETFMNDQIKINLHQKKQLDFQRSLLEEQSNQIADLKLHLDKEELITESRGIRNEFGCTQGQVFLVCPEGQTLEILYADYGQYSQDCNDTCCPPHPLDCTELMSETDNIAWVDLKTHCDNETSCSFLFHGGNFIGDCGAGNVVDYISVYYSCLPESSTSPVGFTAYSSETREYGVDDIVRFENVVSNFGGYYHDASSIFICPRSGIYIFGINVLSSEEDKGMSLQIMRNDLNLIGTYVDNINELQISSSTYVVSECYEGQKVWVRSLQENAQLYGDANRMSSFSGVLVLQAP